MGITPGIHQITVGREPFLGFPPPNSFLVAGTNRSVFIDSGWDNELDHTRRLEIIAQTKAPPISHLLLTHHHPDHAGGGLRLHQELGVPVACHALDREIIERERFSNQATITEELHGGEQFDLGGISVNILFTPGHTLGCIAPYVPELGALFTSDTVMGISTTLVRPIEGDLSQYAESLEQMLTVGAKTIYSGHGPPVADPNTRLRALITHRKAREGALLKALVGRDHSVDELRDALYGTLSDPRVPLANAQVQSMLTKLASEAKVRNDDEGRWRLI